MLTFREYYGPEHLRRVLRYECRRISPSFDKIYCKKVHDRTCKECKTCHFCRCVGWTVAAAAWVACWWHSSTSITGSSSLLPAVCTNVVLSSTSTHGLWSSQQYVFSIQILTHISSSSPPVRPITQASNSRGRMNRAQQTPICLTGIVHGPVLSILELAPLTMLRKFVTAAAAST